MMSDWDDLAQSRRFHAPLREGDTAGTTNGCRHTNPEICRNNSLHGVCAFVTADGICSQPPMSWRPQFARLGKVNR